MTFRAHFDGRVIVPDKPVNLPANSRLEITVRRVRPSEYARPFKTDHAASSFHNDGAAMTEEEIAAMLHDA